MGNNALRMSAREFFAEIKDAEKELKSLIWQQNIENRGLDNTVLSEEIIKKLTED